MDFKSANLGLSLGEIARILKVFCFSYFLILLTLML